jgi:virulence-associated protein VagC
MRVLSALIMGIALAAASPAIACGGKDGPVSDKARGAGPYIRSIDITHLPAGVILEPTSEQWSVTVLTGRDMMREDFCLCGPCPRDESPQFEPDATFP